MKLIVLAAALLVVAPAASGAAFMKLSDIKGESQARDAHTDEIDVLSWSWGMSRSRDGSIQTEPVEVHINSSGGEFWFTDLLPGEYDLGDMVLGVAGHEGLEMHVQGVGISSYRVTAQGDEVREEVAFYYNKISFGSTNESAASGRVITFTGLE